MGELVYALCALTSALCAALLIRSYREHRTSLLLWSALCFIGLAATSALLFVDLVIVPEADLSVLRASLSALSMGTLAVALAWLPRAP
jgi:hypothetical protein